MDLLFGKNDSFDDDDDLCHLYDDELSMAQSASDSSSLSGSSSFDEAPRTPDSHKQRRPSLRKRWVSS